MIQNKWDHSDTVPHLKRDLSFVDLLMTAVGGLVGSGWLFASMTASSIAGPAAMLSWVIGGFAVIILGLSFAELAGMLPEAGGIIRYPRYTHGRFVSFLIGWAAMIAWAGVPPIEAEAVLQYSSSYVHGLYNTAHHGSLTGPGFLVAVILVGFFFLINYLGVKLYARINTPMTFIKFAAPLLTIVAFLIVGFHPANFSKFGGFMPYGWGGVFSAISLGGIIFAFTGFRPMMDLAGEAKNPQRDIPLAFISAMIAVGILYLLLQLVFIGGVPAHALAKGWTTLSYASPYANLALAMNLSWVAVILFGDAVLSPFGTGLVYAAGTPRGIMAFSKNGYFPKTFQNVSRRGTPSATILTYMMGPVSATVLRRTGSHMKRQYRMAGLSWLGPLGFVVGSLIFFWTGWPVDGELGLMSVVGLIIYAVYFWGDPNHSWADIKGGVWLVVYMAFMILWAKIGTFGGTRAIPAPWDEITVAIVAIPFYYWAVGSGRVTEAIQEAEAVADRMDL